MRLFHGSTVTVKRPNIQKGRKATDFGKGFYTTTNFEQAKKWALLKKNREQSEKAIVSVYEVPDDILDREYPVLRFMGATKEWLAASTTVSRAAPSFWPTCDRQKPADTSKMAVNIRGRCHALRWRSRSKAAKSWKDAASIWTETEIG